MKRKISAKQKKSLAKGHELMKKAVALQKKTGVITTTVYSGGRAQKLDVYKLPLNKALKQVSKK
jgi:hypothetical protein